jgi:hypothetical protein
MADFIRITASAACSLCTVGESMQREETIAPAALQEMSRWLVARTTATR